MSASTISVPVMGTSRRAAIAYPLDEFYARSGLPLPPLEEIDGAAVPEPYRGLLVHQNDMTSTLETFHGQQVHLRVLGRERRGEDYFREVVLLLEGSENPVEFGAIKIHLDRFAAAARRGILAEQYPLGHVLKDCAVPFLSRPQAFLRLASDQTINTVLGLSGAHILYGRRNSLLTPEGQPLAEIVEILPPEQNATPRARSEDTKR
jgi:chorismate-pyruvate lyase